MHLLHLEDQIRDAEWMSCSLRRECLRAKSRTRHARNIAALCRGRIRPDPLGLSLPGFDRVVGAEPVGPSVRKRHSCSVRNDGEERAVERCAAGPAITCSDRPTRLVPAIRQALALHEEPHRRQLSEAALRETIRTFSQNHRKCRRADRPSSIATVGRKKFMPIQLIASCWAKPRWARGSTGFAELHPDDSLRARMSLRSARSGMTRQAEFRLRLPDGRSASSSHRRVRCAMGRVPLPAC